MSILGRLRMDLSSLPINFTTYVIKSEDTHLQGKIRSLTPCKERESRQGILSNYANKLWNIPNY